MSRIDSPKLQTYAGLYLVTLAVLVHEFLLTRIFSVTMWYHFAFMAISIAMFGTTVGALLVYLFPRHFPVERVLGQLAAGAIAYAVAAVVTLAIFLEIPISDQESFIQSTALAFSYVLISIPFILAGITVTIALTRFPNHIGKLYAADLAGAATGCLVIVAVLEITDAPTVILIVGGIAALAAVLFLIGSSLRGLQAVSALGLVLFVAGVVYQTASVDDGQPLLRVKYARGAPENVHLYERWNSFSRIHVAGNPDRKYEPSGWGLSPYAPRRPKVSQLYMGIDVVAGTPIIEFNGDFSTVQFLKYDVTNIAHYLRPNADVAVVGVGGGRDVLSALAFKQKSVLGVEINENVLRATNETFGDYSGHLDREPNVEMVVDEARSYLTRSDRRFDIIQISLIDTWAATAAGAFVLAENSLYTVEAWEALLGLLKPRGVLSVSRWYFNKHPAEFHRVASLAREALRARGVENPRDHVLIVKVRKTHGVAGEMGNGVGTLMVSPTPFTPRDVNGLAAISEALGFSLVLTPDIAEDEVYETILSGDDLGDFYDSLPLDVTAPTDDRPFFFQMLRLRDLAGLVAMEHEGDVDFANLKAVQTLGFLLIIVIVLTLLCIIVPLALTTDRSTLRGSAPLLVFFASIGLGFMFVEISQLQRLVVFLGHPTYALSVVLFTLLLAGGIGSLLSDRLGGGPQRGSGVVLLTLLVLVLVVTGFLAPLLIRAFAGAVTPARIAVAGALLAPMGIFMGMAFPLGMRAAAVRSQALTPWLWGVNGATSVCCSVLTIAVSLSFGISASFWAGVACYVVALGAYLRVRRALYGHAGA